MNFFRSLFSVNKADTLKEEEAIEYNGFHIQPAPKSAGHGWTTEAIITKECDGEIRSHHFIRADQSSDREAAISLAVTKSRIMIDQVGDNIFSD